MCFLTMYLAPISRAAPLFLTGLYAFPILTPTIYLILDRRAKNREKNRTSGHNQETSQR